MPGSRYWAQISKKYRTPAKAIWLVVTLSFLFALVDYVIKQVNPNATYTTIAFLTAISVIGLYIAYGIPVYLKLRAQAQGRFLPKHLGPWHLGRWSKWINTISLLWIVFICIIMVIPPNQMALYAVVVLLILLLVMYFGYYRRHFEEPQAALNVSMEEICRREAELQ